MLYGGTAFANNPLALLQFDNQKPSSPFLLQSLCLFCLFSEMCVPIFQYTGEAPNYFVQIVYGKTSLLRQKGSSCYIILFFLNTFCQLEDHLLE